VNTTPDHGPEQRRLRDRSAVVLLLGLLLLMPPLAIVFHLETKIAGIPFTLVYLFGVWAILILAAMRISRRMQDDEQSVEDRE
jgi:hypothetical protein